MQIPGISDLVGKVAIPESLILVTGPSGSGKSVYCRQFFTNSLLEGSYCIYISSSLINKQFRNQFSRIEKLDLDQNCLFINPYLYNTPIDNRRTITTRIRFPFRKQKQKTKLQILAIKALQQSILTQVLEQTN